MKRLILIAVCLVVSPITFAQNAGQLIESAKAAYAAGNADEALRLMDQAVAAAPNDPAVRYARASLLDDQRLFERAVADYSKLIELDPREPALFNRRGAAHFKAGQIDASIADFDRAIALQPESEPHHWQRGISYYYAGRFADGRRQFESHKTVNPNDVENAAWHYLCVARDQNPGAAKAALIPIDTTQDPRVPMKQIYDLYSGGGGGGGSVEQVLHAAEANDVTDPLRRNQRFYAHLYIGLWYEAQGDAAKAREHMEHAAHTYGMPHYMGEVAKVHLARMPAPPPPLNP